VGFSRLRAGHVIPPHEGLQLNFLRCHLGLDVPQGDIGMDVAGETFRWQEGKAFVFDDRKLHHVWNRTSQDRIILIIDFIP
jgi:aspartyl/asparaginyl beta-hydroxylase (cupin superfamily)